MTGKTSREIKINVVATTAKATAEINRLNGDINKLKGATSGVTGANNKMNKSLKASSRGFVTLTKHVTRLAIIYGTFKGLSSTVTTFAEFESSIVRLGAISNASGVELKQLEDKAKSLGESTIYSASQVADGMNSLAMAGFKASEQLDSINSVLDLSTIGLLSLDESALITARTLGAFSLEAEDAGLVGDVIASGATNATTSVKQLGDAFEKVGAVATAHNVSLQETTSALMVMADAGRTGSEAGTQLKIVLSRLGGNTQANKVMNELGISMYDATGKILPFREQIEILRDTLGGLDEKTRNLKLGEIVGQDAKASAIILMNELDKYDDKLNTLQNSFGLASQQAREMQDTLKGSYLSLRSALEGLAIKIGQDLSPALRDIVDDATRFIREMDDAEVANFTEGVARLVTTAGELAVILVDVTKFLASVTGVITDVTGVTSGWLIVLGYVGVKLRKSIISAITKYLIPAIKTLSTTLRASLAVWAGINVAIAPLLVAVLALTTAHRKYRIEVEEMDKTLKRSTGAVEGYTKVIGEQIDTLADTDLKNARNALEVLNATFKEQEREMRTIQKEIAKLSKEFDFFGTKKSTIEGLNTSMGVLAKSMQANRLAIKAFTDAGNELTKVEKKTNNLKEAIDNITGATVKAEQATKKALDKRASDLEKTIDGMYDKERKLAIDLAKLENELAELRKKHAIEREQLSANYQSKMADLSQTTMTDEEKYADTTTRKDEAIAKAKEALLNGNLELYRTYMNEAEEMSNRQARTDESNLQAQMASRKKASKAGEAIQKQTAKSAKEISEQSKKDLTERHELEKQFQKETQAREIQAQVAKIDAKKLEMQMMKTQMDLQMQLLEAVLKLAELAGGIKTQVDLTEFNKMTDELEKLDKDINEKERQLKIDADLDTLNDTLATIVSEVEDTPLELEVEVDSEKTFDEMFTKYEAFKDNVEGSFVKVEVDADTVKAEAEIQKLEDEIKRTEASIKTGANVTQANASIAKLKAQIERMKVSMTVTVNYRHVGRPKGYNVGGVVTPNIMKFANGGSPLENGKNHKRRSGSLGGYGGGDKVKALLEAGEYVIRKEAVRALGLANLHQLNKGEIPKFQDGGLIPTTEKFKTDGLGNNSTKNAQKSMNVNMNIGGQTFKMSSDEQVANQLAEFLRRSTF